MPGLDLKSLGLAFPSRPDLVAEIKNNADSPARVALFNNISSYICDLASADEPALKRRRVDSADSSVPATNGKANGLPSRQAQPYGSGLGSGSGSGSTAATDILAIAAAETVLLEIKDVSVSIPQRKKFDLAITQNYLYARAANTTTPVPGIVYSWHDIEHVFYLPVPEKAQVQYNYVLLPRGAALASLTAPAKPGAGADPNSTKSTPPPPEPLLFTVPATAPKPGSISGPSAGLAAAVSDSYKALLHWAIEGQLRSVANRYMSSIVSTDTKIFHSATRQPFRPQEKAVHVRAFRGSKDGYLFFLPTGILWAFKKPLLFIPLDRISAVSYTNVLQRTFNVVVEVDVGNGEGEGEEVEFGMIDQEDYGTISETYVRRHGLQDRSMAEQRKAKRELAENARGEKKEEGEGQDGEHAPATGEEDDGLTELQRAEQMLQDAEDEEEEDYDPGSDGDSDGSGSSEEEDDDGEGGGDDEEEDDDDGDDDEGGEAMEADDE
ncbi:negative regulator of dna transposition [Ophiostoma piceae UAMH 11346]|uniref:Negative regulator of dna transposition n=1 Tax=Ophiostoma piceae (strain UAMH 11346) TaxID=1262450 RepID=S3CR05_OPHP1|nr:negative regulator of dna transposition [Ophiostoma piceae UAMH 11346]